MRGIIYKECLIMSDGIKEQFRRAIGNISAAQFEVSVLYKIRNISIYLWSIEILDVSCYILGQNMKGLERGTENNK